MPLEVLNFNVWYDTIHLIEQNSVRFGIQLSSKTT